MTGSPAANDPSDRLLRRTRIRLALVTLVMVATLVIVIGVTTAITAITLMHESIDRALDAAVVDPLTLHELFEADGEFEYAGPLGQADTFVMLVDADGHLYGNTTDADLPGLPDMDAIDATFEGPDRRYGSYGETDVRLLTTVLGNAEIEGEVGATTTLYLQAGVDLTLQHELEQQLLLAITFIGLLGIAGAVLVTLFVTDRALVPIREAFATERRFVAIASHELRTPVSIIRASAEILEREGLVDTEGAPLVADIVGETDRMGRLVGDLIALASAQAGAISLDLERIDLGPYYADIARRSGSIVESHGLRFVSMAPPGDQAPVVEADRDRLDQLLLILVDNAIKYSPQDGSVGMGLTVDGAASVATITVSDEGPGVPLSEQKRIFEPFARAPGARKANGDGAGLGLAIARQLALRHGAQLTVENAADAGATFALRLPLARGPRSALVHDSI